mmetsp:Transcript_7012/g.26205  ORF Transcript_7012/g.26205 Transcript_7012/m.26205 type:complete len:325 (+) Transcript_7012:415-1389(+)
MLEVVVSFLDGLLRLEVVVCLEVFQFRLQSRHCVCSLILELIQLSLGRVSPPLHHVSKILDLFLSLFFQLVSCLSCTLSLQLVHNIGRSFNDLVLSFLEGRLFLSLGLTILTFFVSLLNLITQVFSSITERVRESLLEILCTFSEFSSDALLLRVVLLSLGTVLLLSLLPSTLLLITLVLGLSTLLLLCKSFSLLLTLILFLLLSTLSFLSFSLLLGTLQLGILLLSSLLNIILFLFSFSTLLILSIPAQVMNSIGGLIDDLVLSTLNYSLFFVRICRFSLLKSLVSLFNLVAQIFSSITERGRQSVLEILCTFSEFCSNSPLL